MSIAIENFGTDNRAEIPEKTRSAVAGRVLFKGDGSCLHIGDGTSATSLYVELGDHCEVKIGSHCNIGSLFVYARTRSSIVVGDRCGFNGHARLLAHEPATISIGPGCLVASEVDITVSDMHSIIEVSSGKRINPAQDVWIGEKVWIGQRGMVLKGARIGEGTIIGACSVVTGEIPPYSLAVGSPAKVVRQGVTWQHDLV